jgi:hypothetical protein
VGDEPELVDERCCASHRFAFATTGVIPLSIGGIQQWSLGCS